MKKVVFFIVLILTLGGCTSKQFESNYKKMQVSEDGKIDSYSMDLRVYGNYNNKNINEIIKIKNYSDIKYKITRTDLTQNNFKDNNVSENEISDHETKKQKNEIIYIVNDKTYIMSETGKYTLVNKDIKYNDPKIYLDGLNNISKVTKTSYEKSGDTTYKVYEVIYNKKFISKLVADTSISDIKIKNDVTGKIYINDDLYVNYIIYNIESVTINVNYYNIGTSSDFVLPIEIDEEI
jgi:hypothetical protein